MKSGKDISNILVETTIDLKGIHNADIFKEAKKDLAAHSVWHYDPDDDHSSNNAKYYFERGPIAGRSAVQLRMDSANVYMDVLNLDGKLKSYLKGFASKYKDGTVLQWFGKLCQRWDQDSVNYVVNGDLPKIHNP